MNDRARTAENSIKVSPKNIRGLDKILPFSGDSVGFFCVFLSININEANLMFFQYEKESFFFKKHFVIPLFTAIVLS
ncbi:MULTISPECIES: hypothetical protein [Chryseobacterium]|uniref:hypothetical protein n=1 Tax=Chryseobacterium TaxID=59732 RepID=UPI001E5559CF|nr:MULTISPECIES: hypothetical protein [Chryseobacterium]